MTQKNDTYKNVWYYLGGSILIVAGMYYGGKAIAKNKIINSVTDEVKKTELKEKIKLLSATELVDMFNYYSERMNGKSNTMIDRDLMDRINVINGKYQYNFFKK